MKYHLFALTLFAAIALLTISCTNEEGPIPTSPTPAAVEEGWTSLFNGENLEGWIPKFAGHEVGVNYKNTFRVEDGILKVSYDQYEKFNGEFGHLFYVLPFGRYTLRVEYRFIGDQTPGGPSWAFRNSGIMFHSQSPESMAIDQSFPVSIEAQFLGGEGPEERPTMNLCTPGTNVVIGGELITQHCTNSTSATYRGDVWVTVEIDVDGGGTIRHLVEGKTVLEYEEPQLDLADADARKIAQAFADAQGIIHEGRLLLESGYIALQAESHPLEIRKVEIRPKIEPR